jgi:membrane protease YdiL (CAAX protease family)
MNFDIVYLGALALVGYFFWVWLQDYRQNVRTLAKIGDDQQPGTGAQDVATEHTLVQVRAELEEGTMPGATPVALSVVVIAVLVSMFILAVEVAGEYRLGVVDEQSEMNILFCFYSVLGAAFVEELIFRGFLYVDKGSRAALIGSIIAVSFLFAILHQHLWSFVPDEKLPLWQFYKCFQWELGSKPIFSTAILLVNSLWFYYVRFMPLNRYRSLIPCVAAHMASNLGVVLVKALQGKVILGLS